MAIIELYDGKNEFSMEGLDKVQRICNDRISPGYSIVLKDSRGITNNSNIELIIENMVISQPSLLLVLNLQDNITQEFVDIAKGWFESYSNLIKFGIVIEKMEELEHYTALFDGICNNHIMLINKIINDTPPMDSIIDKIIELDLDKILFLDLDHKINLDYKSIANVINNVTEKRRANMVLLQLGCGFPLCMFSKEQIGNIFTSPLLNFLFYCGSKVIIKPDLTVTYCNILDNYILPLEEGNNIIDYHYKLETIKEKHLNIDENSVCTKDNSCWSYRKICGGGCVGCK